MNLLILSKYLVVNASFSGLSGLALVLFSTYFSELFGIENEMAFEFIGLALILFSVFVLWVVRTNRTKTILTKAITFMDVAWVIGSLVILIFGLFNLTKSGNILIGLVAIWIGFLAIQQYRYSNESKQK